MELLMEATSAMSLRVFEVKPKSRRRDERLGCSTLSSDALPIFEFGSSCSLSMLNLVDRLGMIRDVRKSSDEGSTVVMSSWGFSSTTTFLPFLHFFPDCGGDGGGSPPFFLLRKRFMMDFNRLVLFMVGNAFAETLWACGDRLTDQVKGGG